MNKFTIVLQDNETIKEIASDPEVRIKIKDAILDGIGRRALKIGNITDDILKGAKATIKDEFLQESGWNKCILRKEYEDLVKKAVKDEIYYIVREEINKRIDPIMKKINDEIDDFKFRATAHLKEHNFKDDIEEIVVNEIRKKFR